MVNSYFKQKLFNNLNDVNLVRLINENVISEGIWKIVNLIQELMAKKFQWVYT